MPERSGQSEWSRYLGLARALAAREFPGAYRGNLTGALAAVVVPLAMLATYSFVFSRLIPIEFGAERGEEGYVLFLFSGLIVWNLFADVVVRSPTLFVGSPQFVHRARFPVSILVLAPCLASFYRSLPWLGAYLAAHAILGGDWTWVLIASPLVLISAALLTVGVSLGLASIGSVMRDVSDFVPPAMTLLFFLSPVLYSGERLASVADWILVVNPIASIIETMRFVLVDQMVPDESVLLRVAIGLIVWPASGLLLYRTVRRTLPDLV